MNVGSWRPGLFILKTYFVKNIDFCVKKVFTKNVRVSPPPLLILFTHHIQSLLRYWATLGKRHEADRACDHSRDRVALPSLP